MWMTVGTQRFAVTLEDNATARAFAQLLPATFDMIDLHANEKIRSSDAQLADQRGATGLHTGRRRDALRQ